MAQNEETKIQNRCLLDAGSRRDVLAWRQQVGKYRVLHSDAVISIGDVGMADIGLVVAVTITPDMVGKTIGAYAGAEVKTTTGRQSSDQKDWQHVLEMRGGVYRIVRCEADIAKLVDDMKSGTAFSG